MSNTFSTSRLSRLASEAGFHACGVARADAVDEQASASFRRWIEEGHNAGMGYMAANADKRLNPVMLLDGAKSVIVCALNYYPRTLLDSDQLQFAYYAYGQDYHDVIRTRLTILAEALGLYDVRARGGGDGGGYRALICCDTVPVLERYWAWKSGVGWIGKNTNLIIPGCGSFFFLGLIITELEFSDYGVPQKERCGRCEKCVEACPTGALYAPYTLDANKCLSYLTIENRGEIPGKYAGALDKYIYGCDRCQNACPHNCKAVATDVEELEPSEEFLSMSEENWDNLTEEDFRRLFKRSAVKRAKFEGLKRNVETIKQKK